MKTIKVHQKMEVPGWIGRMVLIGCCAEVVGTTIRRVAGPLFVTTFSRLIVTILWGFGWCWVPLQAAEPFKAGGFIRERPVSKNQGNPRINPGSHPKATTTHDFNRGLLKKE